MLADGIIRQSDLDPAKAAEAVTAAQAAYDATDMNNEEAYRLATDRLISAQAMADSISPQRGDKA